MSEIVLNPKPAVEPPPPPKAQFSRIEEFEMGTRKRVPMTLPKSRLSVPDIPGYHLYWFADRQGGGRLIQAMNAGYEFVEQTEVLLQEFGLGNDVSQNRNDDLGSRISIIGGAGEGGAVERLYLMKQRQEWWEEDQKALEGRNQSIMDTIKRTGIKSDGEKPVDAQNRYVKTADIRQTIGRKPVTS